MLDHLVINVMRNMDEARDLFHALGFQLTPRGHHTLGSINHLMLESEAYLELVGIPESGPQRQDVLDSPLGLNGLVFRTEDADGTYARLERAGLQPCAPSSFSRPVEVDGETQDARFRIVRLAPGIFPAGRVYFCQHLTPELVWRDPWLIHPNGFRALHGIHVESPNPEEEARRYGSLIGATAERSGPGWTIGDGPFTIDVMPGAKPRFASASLLFDDLSQIERYADAAPGVSWHQNADCTGRLSVPKLDLVLDCMQRA